MAKDDLQALFLHTLQEVYAAEHAILKSLPKISRLIQDDRVKQAFDHHLQQTELQIERLEKVFTLLDQKAAMGVGKGIVGLLAEQIATLKKFSRGPARDAALIVTAQAIEHYGIARYGALSSWTMLIEVGDVDILFEEMLETEKATDVMLTALAEEVINQQGTAIYIAATMR